MMRTIAQEMTAIEKPVCYWVQDEGTHKSGMATRRSTRVSPEAEESRGSMGQSLYFHFYGNSKVKGDRID